MKYKIGKHKLKRVAVLGDQTKCRESGSHWLKRVSSSGQGERPTRNSTHKKEQGRQNYLAIATGFRQVIQLFSRLNSDESVDMYRTSLTKLKNVSIFAANNGGYHRPGSQDQLPSLSVA